MSDIVKVCKTHGNLILDQVIEDRSSNGLTFSFKCKQCKKEYYERTIEKRRAYSKEYERTKRKRPEGHYENHVKEKCKEWRRKNSDLVNSRVAEDRKKDPERYREYDRKWRRENLERARFLDVVKKHNITYDKYIWMLDLQNGLCAICGKKETRKSRTEGNICRLAIDHNHETGKIRELLCQACNFVIGHSMESIDILHKAIEYLKKHECVV